jgi:hypothetical protein
MCLKKFFKSENLSLGDDGSSFIIFHFEDKQSAASEPL